MAATSAAAAAASSIMDSGGSRYPSRFRSVHSRVRFRKEEGSSQKAFTSRRCSTHINNKSYPPNYLFSDFLFFSSFHF
jgi:hypothetical protein